MTASQDNEREQERLAFLNAAGFDGFERIALGEDASTRRYERLNSGDQTFIFMDAPPAVESLPCPPDASAEERIAAGWNAMSRLAACRVDAFVGIAEWLRSLGLSAPQIHASDVEHGFAVLEDLGDTLFAREIEKGMAEAPLYDHAIESLAAVHQAEAPMSVSAGGAEWPILDYDPLAFSVGADLFPEWYPVFDANIRMDDQARGQWDSIRDDYCAQLAALPQVLLLRDYHAENLLWLPEREGLAKVGILDFQDAIRGPAAWDIAMFIQDARREVSTDVRERVIGRYLDLTGHEDQKFRGELAMAGAINALRIVGLFARLIKRDGKPRYHAFLDIEWRNLQENLKHPAVKDLADFLRHILPDNYARAS